MSGQIDLQKIKEKIERGQIGPALEYMATFLEDFKSNKELLTPDVLRDLRNQITNVKNNKKLTDGVKNAYGKEVANGVGKELNAYIEALFEVEKFQRGLTGKRTGANATSKHLLNVLRKKFGRVGLSFDETVVQKIITTQNLSKDVEKGLLGSLTKKPEEFASDLMETIKKLPPSQNQKTAEPLAALQKLLGLFSNEPFGALMASDAGSLDLGDAFEFMSTLACLIVWGLLFLFMFVLIGTMIVGGAFVAIYGDSLFLRIVGSMVAICFSYVGYTLYETITGPARVGPARFRED